MDNKKESFNILAINPGSTSTKIAVFKGDNCILKENIEHESEALNNYDSVTEQYDYRINELYRVMGNNNIPLESLDAVVGRGGLLKPLEGGTYKVCSSMVDDLTKGLQGQHASNLGGIIAYNIGLEYKIPSFIVDPVCVDEFDDVARISGLKDLQRRSLSHALNMKAVGHKVGKELGKSYHDFNFVITHLGGGISVTAHRKGRMIDVNDANNEGPFSPERSGTLPASSLVDLCFSGKYTHEKLKRLVTREGGIYSYLGTKDVREVEKKISEGDEDAKLILNAMTYQISKEIGAMASTLMGEVDRIIITGGIAFSKFVVNEIKKRVSYIAPVVVIPGEEELESLSLGALRVLKGIEKEKNYS